MNNLTLCTGVTCQIFNKSRKFDILGITVLRRPTWGVFEMRGVPFRASSADLLFFPSAPR